MAKNHEDKVYSGGIRNRINRITMRTTGNTIGHYNGPHTDQASYDPRSVISRTTPEPPTPRPLQNDVKDNDV